MYLSHSHELQPEGPLEQLCPLCEVKPEEIKQRYTYIVRSPTPLPIPQVVGCVTFVINQNRLFRLWKDVQSIFQVYSDLQIDYKINFGYYINTPNDYLGFSRFPDFRYWHYKSRVYTHIISCIAYQLLMPTFNHCYTCTRAL